MSTTQTGDMLDTFPTQQLKRVNFSRFKNLLSHPELFRLVFLEIPFPDSLLLKRAMEDRWRKHFDWRGVTICEFIDDLISAIHIGAFPLGMEKYENPYILIVDDLQHIAGKQATQEEFFSLIKRRIEQKKLTIIFSQISLTELHRAMKDELVQLLFASNNESI